MSEGDKAWLALLGFVVAYDAWAIHRRRETLSSSFDRALSSPIRRWPTALVWLALTIHLFDNERNPMSILRRIRDWWDRLLEDC